MALPKLETPVYTLNLPSTDEEIKFRPFLVKEQKRMIMAQESKDDKQILDARVGSRDQVDAMVAKIVKMANKAIETGMEITKMGKYDRLMTTVSGNEVPIENVTSAMTRALMHYANYIRFANQAEKEKGGYGEEYNLKSAKDVAGTIKKIMIAFDNLKGFFVKS